jgi:hypothetical protein
MGRSCWPRKKPFHINQSTLIYNFQKGRNDSNEIENERVNVYGRNDPITKPSKSLWEMVRYVITADS